MTVIIHRAARVLAPVSAAVLLLLFSAVARSTPTAPPPAAAVIEVLSAGLDGYVDYSGPGVILYRLRNPGPAQKVHLEILKFLKKGGGEEIAPLEPFESSGLFLQYIDLKENKTIEGRWIVPEIRPSYTPDAELFLVVRDSGDRVLGRAALPKIKQSNPIVILTLDPQTATQIQNAILWKSEAGTLATMRPEIALVTDHPPRLWYEYGPAMMVVIARPWRGLDKDEKTALKRWVIFGGTLVIVPQACPDWKSLHEGATLEAGTEASTLGAGRIFIAEAGPDMAPGGAIDEKALRVWLNLTGLSLWDYGLSSTYKSWGAPPLLEGYLMPGTWMLALFVLLIIIVVGPVTHLVLARVRRREWAWILVPGLSLVLALGTYALSSGVKGEGAAMEVQHILRITGDAEECSVSTSVRIMSSDKMLASVRVTADNPTAMQTFNLYGACGSPAEKFMAIHPDLFRISGLLLQKYGIRDLGFLSAAPSIPLWAKLSGEGLRIENTSGMDLRDVFLNAGGFWAPVASRLKSGETALVPRETKGAPIDELRPSWMTEEEWKTATKTLVAAGSWGGPLVATPAYIVARCSPRGLPKVAMEPAPDKVSGTATCAWNVPNPWALQGGVP